MRRKDREITDYDQMLEIVEACDCCRIGLVDGIGSYIVPLNFGYEEREGRLILYFHGANIGKKIDLIKQQKVASFEMDRKHELVKGEQACSYSFLYQCIMGYGNIQIVESYEDKVYGLHKLMSHYSDIHKWEFKEELVNCISVIKLEVMEWSCKVHDLS